MKYLLKVSRPGLWFITIWLYLLPTSQNISIWTSWEFWYGFFYICFPLNFLIYGWNDRVDYETDQLNTRKDSFWFGARGTRAQLKQLWKPIAITQAFTAPLLIWIGGWKLIPVLAGTLFVNYLYNKPQNGLRSRPPLELICQVGYLLIVPLSIYINKLPSLPWQTYVYIFLFAIQSHLMAEVMDIIPDRKTNRKTTATILGTKKTKLLIIGIVTVEALMLFLVFKDHIFGSLMSIGLLWVLLDLFIIFKTRTYSLLQMKLFAFGSNGIALGSMIYVWYSGCLLRV